MGNTPSASLLGEANVVSRALLFNASSMQAVAEASTVCKRVRAHYDSNEAFWDELFTTLVRSRTSARIDLVLPGPPDGLTIICPPCEKNVEPLSNRRLVRSDSTWALMVHPRVVPIGYLCAHDSRFKRLVMAPTDRVTDEMIRDAVGNCEDACAQRIISFNLHHTPVTDATIELILTRCPALVSLGLHGCACVSAVALLRIAKLRPTVKVFTLTGFGAEESPEEEESSLTETKHQQSVNKRTSGEFCATEVIPGRLWLGDVVDARQLDAMRQRHIGALVAVAYEHPPSSPLQQAQDLEILFLPLRDRSDEELSEHIVPVNQFIHNAMERGVGVLVHCGHGISRSASFVIAYLMRYGPEPPIPGSAGQSCPTPRGHRLGNTVCLDSVFTTPLVVKPSEKREVRKRRFSMVDDERVPSPSPRAVPNRCRMKYDEAFAFVKQRRPQISPNLGFMMCLRDYEHALSGTESSGSFSAEPQSSR